MCIFPGLPRLLEGLAMLGLNLHVASTGWRQAHPVSQDCPHLCSCTSPLTPGL